MIRQRYHFRPVRYLRIQLRECYMTIQNNCRHRGRLSSYASVARRLNYMASLAVCIRHHAEDPCATLRSLRGAAGPTCARRLIITVGIKTHAHDVLTFYGFVGQPLGDLSLQFWIGALGVRN